MAGFQKLIAGYTRFHEAYFKGESPVYQELVRQGQRPEVLVIACSDSRIDPAIVTSSAPGDLFVVRNVAAIVPPHESDGHLHGTSAAIEFAVKSLKVGHIVVMGHSLCGGIHALAEWRKTEERFDFIGPWIDIGKGTLAAVEAAMKDADPARRQRVLEQAMVLKSLDNLGSFPWVRRGVEEKRIVLHGWYFDLHHGALEEYDPETGRFVDILHFSPEKRAVAGCCADFPVDVFLKACGGKMFCDEGSKERRR